MSCEALNKGYQGFRDPKFLVNEVGPFALISSTASSIINPQSFLKHEPAA
jgi:hypothetical protein